MAPAAIGKKGSDQTSALSSGNANSPPFEGRFRIKPLWARSCSERPLSADSVEKLKNREAQFFRYRSKISKTAAKFARPDSQALQRCDNRKLATPSAKMSETIFMRRKFLDQRQMWSFSTLSAQFERKVGCCKHIVMAQTGRSLQSGLGTKA